jgi:hypothetical protein
MKRRCLLLLQDYGGEGKMVQFLQVSAKHMNMVGFVQMKGMF